MKWFWVIDNTNSVENPFVADSEKFIGIDPYILTTATKINYWNEASWIKASKLNNDGDPDDVLQNHLGIPIFSPRLKRALVGSGINGIQYLQVNVIRSDGKLVDKFLIANIINKRFALDKKKSDFDVFPEDYFLPERRGKVRGIRKAVLNASELKGCDIIRLGEFDVDIYVSEHFKTVFEKSGFTGYSFRERETSIL